MMTTIGTPGRPVTVTVPDPAGLIAAIGSPALAAPTGFVLDGHFQPRSHMNRDRLVNGFRTNVERHEVCGIVVTTDVDHADRNIPKLHLALVVRTPGERLMVPSTGGHELPHVW